MALVQTHDVPGNSIGSLPRLNGFRACHFGVPEKVHQHEPRINTAGAQEVEMCDAIGQLVEVRCPRSPSGRSSKRLGNFIQSFRNPRQRRRAGGRAGRAELADMSLRFQQENAAAIKLCQRIPLRPTFRPEFSQLVPEVRQAK
jgi:hypothetical protein